MTIAEFSRRTILFFKKYYRYPGYGALYAAAYFLPQFKLLLRFYAHADFAEAIRSGKSFLRFGDGEIYLMHGGSIHYQKYEPGLEKGMRRAIEDYAPSSPYIIGLPVFLARTNRALKQEGKLLVWLPAKVMYKLHFPKDVTYGDAHFFYYDGFFKRFLESYLLDKHLIIVSNEKNISSFKENANIPFTSVSFVETPKEHSYASYEEIKVAIHERLANAPQDKKSVILFSAGPASKPLVYDFANQGYQSIDLGRGLEVFYQDRSIEKEFPELSSAKHENE